MSPTSAKLDVAAITRRMILPDLVFGMSGTIQMFFGRAILPMSVSIAFVTLASTPESAETPGLSEMYISTTRPHGEQAGQPGADEAAGLGLPPGVGDDRLALADSVEVPAIDLGLDRLAHRGHGLEVVVVLGRLVRADLAQHPDRGGGGVEDVHSEPLGDPPRAPGVRVVRRALVEHRGGAERQRAVHDVGVAG